MSGSPPKPRPRKANMIRALAAGYAAIGNRLTQDPKLPGEAMAIAVYCLSQVPHWQVSVTQLHQHFGWSRGRILRYLKALCRRAYCARRRARDSDGTVVGMEYVISDDPNKILEIRFDWNREGRPADDQLDSDLDLAPRSFFPRVDEQRAVNETAVDSNESNKHPPYPPRAGAPPGAEAAVQKPNDGPGAESEPPHADARPEAKKPEIAEASSAPVAMAATGSAREDAGKTLKPVTFALFWEHYEPHNSRNRSKAEERWKKLSLVEQVHAYAALGQYDGYCGRKQQRWEQGWRYLALRLFRQFPLPDEKSDPPPPKEIQRRPDADEVLATPLGLRAAQDDWACDLHDFVRIKGRLPDSKETAKLEADGPWHTLSNVEALGSPAHAMAPYARGNLHRRWSLTIRALKAHGLPQPMFEEYLAPVRKRVAEAAAAARAGPAEQFVMKTEKFGDEIPI